MSPFRLTRAIVAVGAVVVGVIAVLRPFESLTWLAVTLGVALAIVGVGEILRGNEYSSPTAGAAGCVIIAAAMVTAAWPGLPIGSIGIVVACGLAVYGGSRIIDAVRRTGASRFADSALGLASLCLAAVAAADPGLTLFTVCLVLGAALAWSGIAGLFYAFGRRAGIVRPRAPRIIGAALAVLITVPLAVLSIQAIPSIPEPDGFYRAAADGSPGTLLRVDPHNAEVPSTGRAWRILYTTRNESGRPTVASALVVTPARPSPDPSPVVAWAHAGTGIASGCAPSLMSAPFTVGRMPAIDQVLAQGWTLVATDYIGLGTPGPHPFLIGNAQARSLLDAVRAAHSLDDVTLADRTVVWGQSEGGHAALWADLIAAAYTPELSVVGVATTAPIADLRALAQTLDSAAGTAATGAYLLEAYSAAYDDVVVSDYVRAQSHLPMQQLARLCRDDSTMGRDLVQALAVGTHPYSEPLDRGALRRRLSENTPMGATATPLLILQGDDDRLVPATTQAGYVERRRALGADIDYRTYPGRDHESISAAGSPAVDELLTWTRERLN